MIKSKGYLRFINRINYFDIDLELINMVILNQKMLAGKNKIFANIDPSNFPKLDLRKNNSGSRKIILEHLRNTLYVSYIKEIYEEFSEYLKYAVTCASKSKTLDINRFVGSNNIQISAIDLIQDGNWNKIASRISLAIFRQLENEKSTMNLIKKINTKLNLKIEDGLIAAALPYLDMRHSFVHQNGEVDEEFKTKYPQLQYKKKKIFLNPDVIKSAKDAITNLAQEFDKKMIENAFFAKTDCVA